MSYITLQCLQCCFLAYNFIYNSHLILAEGEEREVKRSSRYHEVKPELSTRQLNEYDTGISRSDTHTDDTVTVTICLDQGK